MRVVRSTMKTSYMHYGCASTFNLPWRMKHSFNHLELRSSPYTDFANLLSKVLLLDSPSNPKIFIMISWALWQQCNKFRLHQRVDRIDQVGVKAWCYLVEFVKANEKAPPSLTPNPRYSPETSYHKPIQD